MGDATIEIAMIARLKVESHDDGMVQFRIESWKRTLNAISGFFTAECGF
jgi:hypothetical protein